MSSHGRREGVRIVGPLDQNREKELIGGLKNALERGENLAKAKQTFINAGYQPNEVAAAVQKLPSSTAPIATPVAPAPTPGKVPVPKPEEKSLAKPLPGQPIPAGVPKKKSKILLILIIIVSVLVLVGAGLLGLFWDKFFGA
jgi:hypothetical protein